MDSDHKEELRKIWLKFLNSTSTEDGEIWLDSFLAKYLYLSTNEEKGEQLAFSCGWKSTGNILAHQLLSDMYQTCDQMTSSQFGLVDEDGTCYTSEPLQKYLLEGRGWKLLWTLESIGIENLTCIKDLVNLLIAHIPVAITFPVLPSTVPESMQKKIPLSDFDACFSLPNKNKTRTNNCSSIYPVQNFCNRLGRKIHRSRLNKIHLRQRCAKQKEMAKSKSSSSSEDDAQVNLLPSLVPASQKMVLLKMNFQDAIPMQKIYPSETEDNEQDSVTLESVVCDQIVKDFKHYSVSNIDYINFVVHVLEKTAVIDQKNFSVSSSSSALILDFALDTLKHLQTGQYRLKGWTEVQIKNLRNRLLRLVFISATVLNSSLRESADHVNEIIRTLLVIASEVSNIRFKAIDSNLCMKEDIHFVYDVTIGVLMLMYNAVRMCVDDYAKIVCIVRTFSSCEGAQVYCNLISFLERNSTTDTQIQISKILSLVKHIILSLKILRAYHVHHDICESQRHEFCISSDLYHHHNDIFGSTVSHSITNTEPMCCVAVMNHLTIKIYGVLNAKSAIKTAIRMLQEAGVCCCLDLTIVLNSFLNDFEKHDFDLQQLIFSLLEKTLFPQLGLTRGYNICCNFCAKRSSENKVISNSFSDVSLMEHSNSKTDHFTESSSDSLKDDFMLWKALSIYGNLLHSDNLQSIRLLTKHMNYLFSHGVTSMKNELFMRVIFPQFSAFHVKQDDYLSSTDRARMECFLSVLPCLLINTMTAFTFVNYGGMKILHQVLLLPTFRQLALQALEILMISEIESQTKNSEIAYLYLQEPSVNNSTAIVMFSDIILKYSKSLLQKIQNCKFYEDINQISGTVGNFAESSKTSHTEIFSNAEQEIRPELSNFADNAIVFLKSAEFKTNLNFVCDLWTTYKDLVLQIPAHYVYFISNKTLCYSYDLFLSLLKNFTTFSNLHLNHDQSENEDTLERILLLMQNLLTVFLQRSSSVPTFPEIPNQMEILKTVKWAIKDSELQNMGDLKLLLHMLLFCSLTNSTTIKMNTSPARKNLLNLSFREDLNDTLTSSDRSDIEVDILAKSYDGDSERSDADSGYNLTSCSVLPLQCNRIQHGEVVKVVLELLIHFAEGGDRIHWVNAALHIVQTLVKLCHDCESNKTVLCNQGVCSYLLEGFSEVFKVSNIILEDLQKAVMELFALIAQHSVSANDLKKVLNLFKSPSAPFEIFLDGLNSLVDSVKSSPCSSLGFPCPKVSVKRSSLGTKNKLKAGLQMLELYSLKRSTTPLLNAWGSTATVFPLPSDVKWGSLKKSFSITLWIMLEQFAVIQKQGIGNVTTAEFNDLHENYERSLSSDEHKTLHIISVGSNTVLFESWINILHGDIIFRITTYQNGEIFCLAKATCKCLLSSKTWHHMVLNYEETTEKKIVNSKIHVIIDGKKERTMNLKYENSLVKKSTSYFVLLGHSSSENENMSVEPFYHIGSFMLFKGEVLSRDLAFYLSCLGPDMTNITECALQQRKIVFPQKSYSQTLESEVNLNMLIGLSTASLVSMQRALLFTYTAENPTVYASYPQLGGVVFPLLAPFSNLGNFRFLSQNEWPSQQQPTQRQILVVGKLCSVQLQGLHRASQHVGGITVFLFLFARVIECNDNEQTQASALRLLLHLILSNCYNADYFLKINGDHLLKQLLLSHKCKISHPMLQIFLNCCLSCKIIKTVPWAEKCTVDSKSNAVIINPPLWGLLLKSFPFSKSIKKGVIKSLFTVVRTLLRDDHPHLLFNAEQMRTSQTLDILLCILKENYVLEEDGHLPLDVALTIPHVIKKLLSKPLDPQQLLTICSFLLLLHKTSNTYVCYARSSFFFLFPEKLFGEKAETDPKVDNFSQTSSEIDSLLKPTKPNTEISLTSTPTEKCLVYRNISNIRSLTDLTAPNENITDLRQTNTSKMSRSFSLNGQLSSMSDNYAYNTKKGFSNSLSSFNSTPKNMGQLDEYKVSIDSKNTCFSTRNYETLERSKLCDLDSTNNEFSRLKEDQNFPWGDVSNKHLNQPISPKIEIIEPLSPSTSNDDGIPVDQDHVEIFVGLLHLIRDCIILSGKDVKNVILDIVQPEIFIVLAYNSNARICCAVLKVISAYLHTANEEQIENFHLMKGFHLLANQLHQFPADSSIIDACFSIIFPEMNVNEEISVSNSTQSSMQLMAWVPLLAVLPKTYEDVSLCNRVLCDLNQLLSEMSFVIMELTNNGLYESLCHLLLNISHSYCREYDLNAILKLSLLKSINNIFQLIASELFSCKDSSCFSAFSYLLNLFSTLEAQSHKECGSSAQCVSCLRDCQCVIFQSALDFLEMYNYRQMKSETKSELDSDKNSIWEILISMPDTLNPYSTFVSTFAEDLSSESESKFLVQSSSSFSPIHSRPLNILQNVQKANKELAMSEAVDRFQFILSRATDFIVFRDPECEISEKQKSFFRGLLRSMVKGLSTLLERNKVSNKTKWTAVMWSAKDLLKLQLSRLLVASLAPGQDLEQRCYVLEVIANQPKCSQIVNSISFAVARIESLPIFLYDLLYHQDFLTEQQNKDLHIILACLKEIFQNSNYFAELKDISVVAAFKKEWIQLWNEDRQKWMVKQTSLEKTVVKKLEKLANQISKIAADVTKDVVEMQNIERKKFMEEVKLNYSQGASTRSAWHALIEQLTHERAAWHIKESYPASWELDPTEGPMRIRKRLRRCHLNIEPRFLMPEFQKNLELKDVETPFVNLFESKNGFSDSSAVIYKLHSNEKIEYTCACKVVTPYDESKGEILIGDCCIHFIGEEKKKQRIIYESWPFKCIKEILPRRFELQNNAFEIFMATGLTYLVTFQSIKDLENVWKRLENYHLPCVTEIDASSVTQLWRDHSITNFEYLTQLNKLAGRSFNDLMQYPVFPFILADYSSSVISLSNPEIYRNLVKPVAVQQKKREEYYMNAYKCLKEEQSCGPWSSCSELPLSSAYHYGSHYSNSGTVLHFLVRLLPYTCNLITYQDNNFDIPDRTFHSIDTSWQLISKESTSDVKELVPEFFFLPEFLCNKEGFDFGVRQTGIRVNDVLLPPWSKQNPRLFIFIQRQALESDYVTNNLHNWIDLVFGYKQTGKAAVNAINVFHPATYFGLDVAKLEDPITRQALHAMIKTVGQMPRQLFPHPHPMVALFLTSLELTDLQFSTEQNVMDTVDGLKWGSYVGSPSTGIPNLVWRRKQSTLLGHLLSVLTNDVFGLPPNICLLLNHSTDRSPNISSTTYIMSAALISWAHEDGIVRIKFCRDHPPVPLLRGSDLDPVCLCSSVPDCKELFIAHTSGIIFVYDLNIDPSLLSVTEKRPSIQLSGHSGAITSIHICKSFSIVVTASEDKTCIIWDLNRLCYIRSILDHTSPVKLVCVSDTLGDIASVSDNDDGSCLKVHTINGELVGNVKMSQFISALCYSTAPEGVSVNVVATGMSTGSVRLWSSWDLKPVREIKAEKFFRPITCLTFSADNQHLYAANTDGVVAVWEKPSKGLTTMPRFLMFS